MPDLQTELSKVLNQAHFDDDEGPAPTAPAQTNLRIKLFSALHDHPMSTTAELAEHAGVAAAYAANALSLWFTKGIADRTQHNGLYRYTAAVNEYPSGDRMANLEKARVARSEKAKARAAAKHVKRKYTKRVAPTATPTPKVTAAPTVEQGVQQIIDTMSVVTARAMYDALKKIFGG